MNRFAYRTTGLAIKALSGLSRARIRTHGEENIPDGSIIFVINHFTRMETLLMPWLIFRITGTPVWSLADAGLFSTALRGFLDSVGAVSTRDPDRDRLIVKSLLTGEASWIIYPEGRMVKNKKVFEKGRFMISGPEGKHRPHTGPATLALRSEFYRQRLLTLNKSAPHEARRVLDMFRIEDIANISTKGTYIVPVNITYYPLRAQENMMSFLASRFVGELPERVMEEIMTEGTMLLSGVDVDVRFGDPLEVLSCIKCFSISRDISDSRPIGFDDPIPSRARLKEEAMGLMHRYMTAIYRLTTVNYDHLLACLLRWIPFRRISAGCLRQRVFLIASESLKNLGVYCHTALEHDQIHLLTDDRHHRVADFLRVAIEKGAIEQNQGTLTIRSSKIRSTPDLHRARIDNPVAVIANSVEPLVELQEVIRKTARQPEFWVRRKIVQRLTKMALTEFEADYQAHYVEGESKPMDVGKPFLIRGRSRKMGVLLIHGYMAAPLEVRRLAEYLGRKGLWVYVPRLKGHGTSPEDLAACSYRDWVRSADLGYAVISTLCRRVVVGGFSTGAGVALEMASRIDAASGAIGGVFAVSTPMRLQDLSARFASAVTVWNRIMDKVNRNGAKKEFVENTPENPHINYRRNPVSGVVEIERLMDEVESGLPALTVPALVIQSYRDPVVDPKGSEKVFRLIGSTDKTYTTFNFDRHGILNGDGCQRVYQAVGEFIDHAGSVPAAVGGPLDSQMPGS